MYTHYYVLCWVMKRKVHGLLAMLLLKIDYGTQVYLRTASKHESLPCAIWCSGCHLVLCRVLCGIS